MPSPSETNTGPESAPAFGDETPLTMEFKDGELIQVSGTRLEHMDWRSLFRLNRRLAKLNLAQELEIGRYKAEVEGHEAECERLHSRNMAADAVERRDLFAMAALMQHASLLTITRDDDLNRASQKVIARLCYSQADAMEAARAKAVQS
ncbi:MAG: hypothetical protein K2Z25_02005 [Beijerinckiaceae bacterium]|nr:hypothetical protein [Beijerinckiaceae bacterium]